MNHLTGDILKKLSPGACRLLLTYQEEPDASLSRCMELTGYSQRWIKRLRRELQQAGVIADGAASDESSAESSGESDQAYQALTSFGVRSTIARELSQQHPWPVIQDSIRYVQSRSGIANRAGYLVKRLREQSKESKLVPVQAEIIKPDSVATPPILSGDRELPANVEWQMLAYSVTVACGCDLNLNPAAAQAVHRLHDAGYAAEDVGYFLKAYWPTIWPGSSGDPPTLAALLEHIGHAKHLLDMADGRSRGDELLRRIELLREHLAGECSLEHPDDLLPPCEGDPDLSPYAGHPRFESWIETEHRAYEAEKQQQRAEDLATNCPACHRSRQDCTCSRVASIPGRIKDSWLAVMGQLQIQLNRATYDTWLRRLTLAGYMDGELVVETPDRYTQEWVERHLLPSLTRTFNDIYQRRPSDAAVRIRLRPMRGDPFQLARLL